MIRSTPSIWLLMLAFALLAVPATAEVFHVTLTNGTTVDSAVQPQQASWDPNMVMLLTDVGNWVGFPKDEIADIKAVDPTAGFGVRISSTAIALGRFSNDLPEPTKGGAQDQDKYLAAATRAMEAAEKQQHYSVQQFVEPNQTQGIPAAFAGSGGYGSNVGGSAGVPLQGSPGPGAGTAAPVNPPNEK
ncbi:MAG TPA: hypothetical protein VGS07_04150 [Thermoanaerobaculia bacterium]|jgi:hypothetical protein|nr:hypothetical protein [Thermoanaerobaculia bacterium]